MKDLWKHNDIPQYCNDINLFKKTNDFSDYKLLLETENYKAIDELTEEDAKENNAKGVDAIIS